MQLRFLPVGKIPAREQVGQRERKRDAWVEFSEQLPVTTDTERWLSDLIRPFYKGLHSFTSVGSNLCGGGTAAGGKGACAESE